MSTWGISDEEGFYRPNLTEVIEDTQTDLQNTFGSELNMSDNSKAGMLAKVQAGREFKVWQQLEATYYSQTRNGAEGDFMDEMYAYQNVTRNAAAKGTGNVIVQCDATSENIDTISVDTTFTTTGGVQYLAETTRTMSEYVRGYKIDDSTLTIGSYSFTIVNSEGSTTTGTYSLVSNDDADRETFFNNLKTLFDEALPDDTATIIVDTTVGSVSFYVGYTLSDDDYLLTGTEETFEMTFGTNRIGTRSSEHAVIAVDTGENVVGTYSMNSMTPTPDGYVDVTNIESFYSGSDVETDAAFSARFDSQSDSPNSSTRPAIIASILDIDNVSGASLDKVVDTLTGVVTVEPIIFGGEIEDIAQVLYETQPVNNQYIGDISYTVTTEDGKTEDIYFSRGTDVNMSVRVTYSPLNGVPLATSEQEDIQDAIEGVNSYLSVGGTVFNGQLAGAVFDVNPQRFTVMTVYIKKETDDDSAYSTADYVMGSSELPVLSSDRVEIIQVS